MTTTPPPPSTPPTPPTWPAPDRSDVYALDSPEPATEQAARPAGPRLDALRQQWHGTPLRVRLVAMLVALALIALSVTAAVAVALLQGELVAKVDAQVTAVTQGVTGDGPLYGLGNPQDRENQLPSSQYAVVVLDSGIQVRIGRQLDDTSPVPDVSRITPQTVAQHDGRPFTVPATRGGDEWRVVAVRVAASVPAAPAPWSWARACGTSATRSPSSPSSCSSSVWRCSSPPVCSAPSPCAGRSGR